MTKLYVAEYPGLAATVQGDSIDVVPTPPTVDYVVDFTAGAAASPVFQKTTRFITIAADSICCIAFGIAPVATTANQRIPANAAPIKFGVISGQQISAITALA